jgi:putative SOS response-associated peptidase YedK
MCGRVRLSSDYSEIKIRLKFAPNSAAPNFEPDWNKPPTAPMLVAIRSIDGERVPKMMKWGLIPHWAKDDKLQYSTFNARAEEFRSKPAFRDAWARGQRTATLLRFNIIRKRLGSRACRPRPRWSNRSSLRKSQ